MIVEKMLCPAWPGVPATAEINSGCDFIVVWTLGHSSKAVLPMAELAPSARVARSTGVRIIRLYPVFLGIIRLACLWQRCRCRR